MQTTNIAIVEPVKTWIPVNDTKPLPWYIKRSWIDRVAEIIDKYKPKMVERTEFIIRVPNDEMKIAVLDCVNRYRIRSDREFILLVGSKQMNEMYQQSLFGEEVGFRYEDEFKTSDNGYIQTLYIDVNVLVIPEMDGMICLPQSHVRIIERPNKAKIIENCVRAFREQQVRIDPHIDRLMAESLADKYRKLFTDYNSR